MSEACFTAADILLPAAGVPLDSWACIAVDQFTSQPEYWQRAEHLADGKPSTLHIVLPEAYLGTPQEAERLESIRRTMEEYRKSVLTRKVHGYVYVERTQMDGTVRQGLVGAVDLDAYDYAKGSKPAIRPRESTVVERIPPRLKVRRGATLETPHVMMLADDADCTLIEPIGLMKNQLPPLYDGELMLGGGHLRGWAVEDPALIAGIDAALAALADPAAFARRWPAAKGQQPMVLAVGDGNHSLATAKAYWEELKPTLSEEQRRTHPARWCLAEVCNVHSPAIEIEPIHRVVFGVGAKELYAALDAWDQQQGSSTTMSDQRLRLADAHGESAVALANPPAPLTVGSVEAFLADFLPAHPGVTVDYIHGESTALALASDPAKPATAILLPDFAKADLFKGVVLGGVLPRKTFSMGHAEEKRYYNECRVIGVEQDSGELWKKLHKPRTVHRTVAAAVALPAMAAPRRHSSPRVRGKPPHSRASRPLRPLRPQPPRPRAARMRPAPMAATPAAGRADPPNRRASRHRARMPRPSARLHPRMRPRAHALPRPSRRAAMPARPRRCPASRCATSPRHRVRPAMPAPCAAPRRSSRVSI